MSLEFHKATPEDLPGLQRILEEARAYKLKRNDKTWGTRPFDEKTVKEMVDSGNTYVGYINGDLAASLALIWSDEQIWGSDLGNDNNAGYLHTLATSEAFRGQRVGEEAIQWATEQVKANGKKFLRLDCSPDNHDLCEYYESQGFDRVGLSDTTDYPAALYEKTV
jgi:ribosomal protein S18 acetylase RimI-like enzyme